MPITSRTLYTADTVYNNPFLGPVDHVYSVNIDPGNLTTDEVDAAGYLKPGTPLAADGTLLAGAGTIFGAVIEPTKVAASNSDADLAAAPALDVTVGVIGILRRVIAEENLGRAFTAEELAGFAASKLVLV